MFQQSKNSNELYQKRIRECPLFGELSSGELKALLRMAHIRDYTSEEKIFTEGTLGLSFYIVVKGSVQIVGQKGSDVKILKEYKEGDFFSEVHLFTETNHTVSGISKEISKLIIFSKPDFEYLVKIKPKLGNKILFRFLEFFGEQLDRLYNENKKLKQSMV
jgi:CRP-like cAMP-binding protein